MTLRTFLAGCVAFWGALFVLTAEQASAQPRTHVYGVLGAGPAELSGGVDWLIDSGPMGIQAEAGLLAISLGPSYHFFDRHSPRRLDLFATAAYLALSDLNYEDVGASIGAGIVYWRHEHVGFRLDAYRFLPVRERIVTAHHHWGIQGGVAFSFRSTRKTSPGDAANKCATRAGVRRPGAAIAQTIRH